LQIIPKIEKNKKIWNTSMMMMMILKCVLQRFRYLFLGLSCVLGFWIISWIKTEHPLRKRNSHLKKTFPPKCRRPQFEKRCTRKWDTENCFINSSMLNSIMHKRDFLILLTVMSLLFVVYSSR
jgi:hypothetical protein